MSDHDTGPLPELTPEQESEVRRLLAEARHDEPVPADVAARLDDVLADLTREAPGRLGDGDERGINVAPMRGRRTARRISHVKSPDATAPKSEKPRNIRHLRRSAARARGRDRILLAARRACYSNVRNFGRFGI